MSRVAQWIASAGVITSNAYYALIGSDYTPKRPFFLAPTVSDDKFASRFQDNTIENIMSSATIMKSRERRRIVLTCIECRKRKQKVG
jgi:hypothetical protein